jgi:hypothetical protein
VILAMVDFKKYLKQPSVPPIATIDDVEVNFDILTIVDF